MAAADATASESTFAVLDARLVRVSRENAVANAESAVMELRSAKVAAPLLEKAEQVCMLASFRVVVAVADRAKVAMCSRREIFVSFGLVRTFLTFLWPYDFFKMDRSSNVSCLCCII